MLNSKLCAPRPEGVFTASALSKFLPEHADEIISRALASMKTHPRIGAIELPDLDRVDHIPELLEEVIRQLQSGQPDDPTAEVLAAGAKHGEVRRQQGYSQEMLVDDTRVLDSSIYSVVQDHLLEMNLSNLIPDLSRMNDGLQAHLQASLTAFGAM
jgi:hypothetical protein